MNADQIYTLTKLRAAEAEERARHSRLVAGRKPEPLWRVFRARVARAGRLRVPRPAVPRTDGHDVVGGR